MVYEVMIPPPPPPPTPSSTKTFFHTPGDSTRNNLTSSHLIDAIKAGNTSKVEELLSAGEDINQATIFGTPLSVAVREGNLELVKLLTSLTSCQINSTDYDGETAFSLSLRKPFYDISLYLISKGCALDRLDPVSNISYLATAVEQKNIQVVNSMLAHRCQVDIRDSSNLTPLAHACLLPEREFATAEDRQLKAELIKILYKSGADVNVMVGPLSNGHLLHQLTLAHCCHATSILLELDKESSSDDRKLDINKQNPVERNTALNLAVAICDKDIVELLLSYGAKSDIGNVFCDTPLSKAINDRLYDQSEIIQLLLDYGADPNFEETISRSHRRKGPCKPLFAAIENGNKDMLELLIKYGAELSSLDHAGRCPIMPCLSNGLSIGLLHYVVDAMDEQHISYDISSWQYLHAAFPWTRHLQYLIDRGLDINVRSEQGHKILHTNAVKFYPASFEVLLKNGLDPDSLSGDGNTMLASCAGLSKYWEAIRLLMQYGADINRVYVSDNEDEKLSPLQRAFISAFEEDVETVGCTAQFIYLLNCGASLSRQTALWRDSLVADSDSDSSLSMADGLSDYRRRLLADIESAFAPLPLTMCCRNVIRSTILVAVSPGKVKESIYSLQLPTSMKDFVAFINVPTSDIVR
ncbi:ankyrin repeat domain-containing protein 50-like isoform X2 [Watersipora subatra]|uniref:ankyrin repeat domain-containing protein 50-like isoform X2 n=1 Tax=Watersipora subatra TaxID=2589382 RepID=UPI00355BAF31